MLHAVDDVNFKIAPREIIALVGESGSGESTIARLLTLTYRPTSGEIRFKKGKSVQELRGRKDDSRTAAMSRWSSRIRTAR